MAMPIKADVNVSSGRTEVMAHIGHLLHCIRALEQELRVSKANNNVGEPAFAGTRHIHALPADQCTRKRRFNYFV